ncbi:protein ODORANT1-like [Vitis riparia]|uniref:protein ODORANT1-like n=1 Tax=Vitis riparia TaxID=96939 RepID=UPI00155B09C3|nr:protein ODORANT1-like [Vitis riparia]
MALPGYWNSLMAGQKKPRWDEVEDWVLFECRRTNLDLSWPAIAERTELGRSGKSCWERFKNHLDPYVKKGKFSKEEDKFIIDLQSRHGNRWTKIADRLGRTDNDVKNRWHEHLKKKELGRSTGDQPHTTQPFHLNHNIDPNASSSSITSELPPLDSEFMQTEEVIKCFSD